MSYYDRVLTRMHIWPPYVYIMTYICVNMRYGLIRESEWCIVQIRWLSMYQVFRVHHGPISLLTAVFRLKSIRPWICIVKHKFWEETRVNVKTFYIVASSLLDHLTGGTLWCSIIFDICFVNWFAALSCHSSAHLPDDNWYRGWRHY